MCVWCMLCDQLMKIPGSSAVGEGGIGGAGTGFLHRGTEDSRLARERGDREHTPSLYSSCAATLQTDAILYPLSPLPMHRNTLLAAITQITTPTLTPFHPAVVCYS